MNGPSLVSMRPLLKRKTFSLGALVLFVAVAVGFGIHFNFFGRADVATLYVAPTGSDSNSCTQTAPCLSFNRAYQLAAPWTTVSVASGTYGGQTINWDSSKLSATSNVSFQPAAGAAVNVKGNIEVLSSHVSFANMALQDPSNPTNKYDVDAYAYEPTGTPVNHDVGFVTFQNITARNFEISAAHDISVLGGSYGPSSACQSGKPSLTQYGGGNNALRPEPGAPDPYGILIDGVTVHNIMSYDLAGCHTEGVAIFSGSAAPQGSSSPGGVTIRNSKFYGNDVYDILAQANSGSGALGPITLENNWFGQSTNGAGSGTGSWGVELDSMGQNQAVNILNNSFNFPLLFQDPASTLSKTSIVGNILPGPVYYSTSSGSVGSMCGRSGVVATYNITASASGQTCSTATNIPTSSVSGLYANPTNDASMNYALKAGSQALNLVPNSAYATTDSLGKPVNIAPGNDIDYHCRPASGQSNIDAGASELNATGSCGTPTGGSSSGGGGPTNTPPTAAISAPANNATINATTTLTASAGATTSGATITSVQFMIDGQNVGSADTSSPYTYSLDTTSLSNASHTITAKATDSNGLSTVSSPISVTVANSVSSGGGSSDCTVSNTVSTTTALANAVSSAANGATICVASGNYGAMTWTGSNRTSKAVVKPASGATVTFTGTLTINASEVEVQNISMAGQLYQINGPAHDVQMTNVTAGHFIIEANGTSVAQNITIKGGSIGPWHSYPDNWIVSGGGSAPNKNIMIDGVIIHDFEIAYSQLSTTHFECLQVWAADGLTIQNSKFTNCSVFDIFIQAAGAGQPPAPTNVLIQNNFFDCCSYTDVGYRPNSSIMLPTDHGEGTWKNVTIRNNSGDDGITVGSGPAATFSNDVIENNILPSIGFSLPTPGVPPGLKVDYNLWYSGSKVGTHDLANVSTTSLFTNFAGRDFHTLAGSPAIDKADATIAPTAGDSAGTYPPTGTYPPYDIDGSKRPQGNGPDIGASETTGSASVTPPTTPTGLHATGNTQTSIGLSWAASTDSGGPGLKGYHVYRNGNLVGTATGTSYTDTGLTASTSYSYTIDAYDTSGNASTQSSPPVVATTAAAQQTINPPTNVQAQATAPNSVALTWTASPSTNATHYYVVRSDSHTPAATIAILGAVTSYTDATVTAATAYTYYVMAGDDNGNYSSPSNNVMVTTPAPPDTTPPSVPGGVSAQAVSSVQVNLSWSASADSGSGVAGYYIYRSDKGTKPYAAVTTGTSWGESGLTPGATYTYTVSAYDALNNVSTQSAPASVTMPAVSGTVTLGSNTVKRNVDSIGVGSAKAFRATAKGNGSVTKLQLYIDGSSKSSSAIVGIYQNTGQRTGKLLSVGSSQLKAGAWNTITIPATTLSNNQVYWIAVLNRGSANLVMRDSKSSTTDTQSSNPNLTTLPTQWTPGAIFKNSPASAYVSN